MLKARQIVTICFLSALTVHAAATVPANSIYIEGLGAGGWGSLNFERHLIKWKQIQISARAGLSTYRLKDFESEWNPDFIVPAGFQAGYGKKHSVELGAGTTFSSVVKFDFNKRRKKRKSHLNYYASVGYKFRMNRVFLRLAYYSLYLHPKYFKNWAGVGIGYKF